MSYVERNLAEGEVIQYRSQLTWLNWPGALFLAIALGWLLGLGILLGLAMIVRLVTTEIAITNRRFIYKTGWLSQTVSDIQLGAIESSTLVQGLWGRILGFGTLTLHGTGIGTISLPNIDDPQGLKQALENAAQRVVSDAA